MTDSADDFSQTPLLQQFLGSRQTRSQNTNWQELCIQLMQFSKQLETKVISITREKDDIASKLENYQARQHDLQNELQAMERQLKDTETQVYVQRQERDAAIQDRDAATQEKNDAIKDKERALQAKEAAIQECNKLRDDLRQAEEKQSYSEDASAIELDTMDQHCSHNEVAKIWEYKQTIELLEAQCRDNAIAMSKYRVEIDRQRREHSDVLITSRLEVEALQAKLETNNRTYSSKKTISKSK